MTDDRAAGAGDGPASEPRLLRTTRMEAFSDGVFAIAITLLVLDIVTPPDAGDDLLGAVLALWPSYLAYVVSFGTIGAIWLAHNAITEYLRGTTVAVLRWNLLLLLVVAFLPFPTRLLGEHADTSAAERVAVTSYGATLLAAALLLAALWRSVRRAGLVRPDAGDREVVSLTRRLTPGLAGYLVLIGVGLIWPLAAVVGYLLVAVYLGLPLRRRSSGPFRTAR